MRFKSDYEILIGDEMQTRSVHLVQPKHFKGEGPSNVESKAGSRGADKLTGRESWFDSLDLASTYFSSACPLNTLLPPLLLCG